MKNALKSTPLTEAQVMVLQVVKEQYNEEELEDLRGVLLDFNARKMQQHLDKTVESKGYAADDFERMLKGHDRKKR